VISDAQASYSTARSNVPTITSRKVKLVTEKVVNNLRSNRAKTRTRQENILLHGWFKVILALIGKMMVTGDSSEWDGLGRQKAEVGDVRRKEAVGTGKRSSGRLEGVR